MERLLQDRTLLAVSSDVNKQRRHFHGNLLSGVVFRTCHLFRKTVRCQAQADNKKTHPAQREGVRGRVKRTGSGLRIEGATEMSRSWKRPRTDGPRDGPVRSTCTTSVVLVVAMGAT